MKPSPAPVEVAILAFPETTASVTYGMYDLFMAAGRDWGFVVTGQPGRSLIRPRIVAAHCHAFVAANDASITPQVALADQTNPHIVCVSELALPPTEPLTGRFIDEIAWLKRCYAKGATRHRVLGGGAACRGRLARWSRGYDALGLLRYLAQPLPSHKGTQGTRSCRLGRRSKARHGRWRNIVAGPGAVPHRSLRGHRCRDACRTYQSHRLARHRAAAIRQARAVTTSSRCGDRALSDMDCRSLSGVLASHCNGSLVRRALAGRDD